MGCENPDACSKDWLDIEKECKKEKHGATAEGHGPVRGGRVADLVDALGVMGDSGEPA